MRKKTDTNLAAVEFDMLRHAMRCISDHIVEEADAIFGTPMSTTNRQNKKFGGPKAPIVLFEDEANQIDEPHAWMVVTLLVGTWQATTSSSRQR